jgi:hypothetical protein
MGKAGAEGGAFSSVLFVQDQTMNQGAILGGMQNRSRAVGGEVIDDDNLERKILTRRGMDCAEEIRNSLLLVIAGNDHRKGLHGMRYGELRNV